MTDKTQPTAHAEITAPISADLRGIDDAGAQPDVLRKPNRECFDAFMKAAEDAGVTHMQQWVEVSGYQCADCKTPLKQGYDCGACGSFEAEEVPDLSLQAAPPAPAAVAVPELRLSDEQIEQAFISARDEFMLREVERTDKKLRLAFGRAVLHSARAALAAAPAQAVAVPAEVELPDVEDMAHSAVQEALSYGVSHDVFHRWMRAVMDKTVQALAAAPAQEHATQLAGQALPADEFRGDTASLVRNIVALLDMDAQGCLVPHGVGGHARGLLSAAASRLAAPAQAQEDERDAELFRAMANAAITEDAAFGECLERLGGDCKTIDDIRAVFDAARAAQGGAA